MRFVLAILIVSIFVSGYSAAAHAFGAISMNDNGQVEAMDMSKCHGHHDDSKDQDKTAPAKKGMDMNCHYCCASIMATCQTLSPLLHLKSGTLSALPLQHVVTDVISFLFRPPQSFV